MLNNNILNTYKTAVLVPAYNCQNSLILTLNSFDKSFPVYILIVDDGSKIPITVDKDNFYPHKIEIHHKKFNSGIEDTLRLGVEIIEDYGFEFFARIDAGDTCKNNRFKLQYEHIKKHANLSWLGAGADVVSHITRKRAFSLILVQNYQEIKKYFFFKNSYIHPALIFRTKHVIAVGNYMKKYTAAEDMDLLLRLMKKYKTGANLKNILIDYEINPNGISSQKRKTQIQSTLKLQFKYIDVLNIYWYLGLMKNISHLFVPSSFVYKLKTWLFK